MLELTQRAPGFDPELGQERPPRCAVCLQCLALAAGAVEREHQLCAEPFPQRVPRDEPFQLWHETVVSAEGKLRFDSVLQRRDVQLFEALDLVLGKAFVREIRQRGSPPERECAAELVRRLRVLAALEGRPALGEQPLEAVAVELVRLHCERIRAANRPDAVGRQLLAQRRHAVLEHLGGSRWRALAPELVDDDVARQRLVAVEEQEGQHCALPRAAERELSFPVERLERPEDAVVHRGSA